MNEANYIHPFEYLFDDEERWCFTSEISTANVLESDESLSEVRDSCRWLALTNEFAVNAHENRISYVVGSGHGFFAEARPGRTVDSETHVPTSGTVD